MRIEASHNRNNGILERQIVLQKTVFIGNQIKDHA